MAPPNPSTIPLLDRAAEWADHPVPEVRLMALGRLERALGALRHEEASSALGRFDGERHGWVRERARSVRLRLRAGGDGTAAARSGSALLASSVGDDVPVPEAAGPLDAGRMRRSALELLDPLVQTLLEHPAARSPRDPDFELFWSRVAGLGHPALGAAASKAFQGRGPSVALVQALARSGLPDCERLLMDRLESSDAVAGPWIVRELPGLRHVEGPGTLSRFAGHEDAAIRGAVAAACKRIAGSDRARLLTPLLADASPRVAGLAVGSIGTDRDAGLGRGLIRLALSCQDVRTAEAAVRALAMQPLDDAGELSRLLEERQEPRVIAAAVDLIALLPAGRGPRLAASKELRDHADPEVRVAVALAGLPELGEHALRELERMLDGDDPFARRSAARRVGDAPCPGTVDRAAALVPQAGDPVLQAFLLAGLRAAASGCPAESIAPLALEAPPHVVAWAVDVASERPGRAWGGLLSRVASDAPTGPVRDRALLALARRHGRRELKTCLNPRRPELALPALNALESYSAFEVVPTIEPLLDCGVPSVEAAAAVALWRLGHVDCLAALSRLLDPAAGREGFRHALEAVGAIASTLEMETLERHPDLVRALTDAAARDRRHADSLDTLGLTPARAIETAPSPVAVRPAPAERPGAEDASSPDRHERTPLEAPQPSPADPLELRILEALSKSGREGGAARDAVHGMAGELTRAAEGFHLLLQEAIESEQESAALELGEELLARVTGPMVTPYLQLGQLYSGRWDRSRAVRSYLKAVQAQLASLAELSAVVSDQLDRDDIRGAEAGMAALTRLMPLDGSVHRTLGECFLEGRKLGAASRQLFFAHVISPEDLALTLKLAIVCIQTGRRDLARALASSILDSQPAGSPWAEKAQRVIRSLERARGDGASNRSPREER